MIHQLELGERLKDAGTKSVLENAGEIWRERFHDVAFQLVGTEGAEVSASGVKN